MGARARSGGTITVAEARSALAGEVVRTPAQDLELSAAVGRRSAEVVHAPCDHPHFDMSAVDGFAFRWADGRGPFKVVASLAAGDPPLSSLPPGTCARIFTGAMMPPDADTVVMQEFTTMHAGTMSHDDDRLKPGGNVRLRGEQLRQGELLLGEGAALCPATVGLLASFGVRRLSVHGLPRVAIVRTGGEFMDGNDTEPVPGRIFSSNELMLQAALAGEGIHQTEVFHPRDEREELLRSIRLAAPERDVVITTGGVSVGDHDLVADVLRELDARIVFHGVRQKPGKPMLVAQLGGSLVFGLPGNPRAVLVAWWVYVLPFLRAMQGAPEAWPRTERLPLAAPLQFKGARAEFRAAAVRGGRVHLLRDEGSHMLRSLIGADALALLPVEGGSLQAGDAVDVLYLDRQ